jgi:hypothetical protein
VSALTSQTLGNVFAVVGAAADFSAKQCPPGQGAVIWGKKKLKKQKKYAIGCLLLSLCTRTETQKPLEDTDMTVC